MKNIELTKDHKSKLLEMCKILFPEWTFITFQESAIMGAGWDYDFNNICFSKKSETLFDIEINIHWFEFCMTHLIVQLSKEFTKQKLSKSDYTSNQYPNWFSQKLSYHLNPFRNEEFEEDIIFIHPVDYLYKEFKKLK